MTFLIFYSISDIYLGHRHSTELYQIMRGTGEVAPRMFN